jgi:hypothetical protein
VQSENLRIRLRRRSEWEAFGLGRVMLREWRRPIYAAWACTYGLVALIVVLATPAWPAAAPWVLWWLKPFFDRVLVFVLGQCVFGRSPSLGNVWRALPGILRHSGLLSGLTIRRFSPIRSLLLPVWQLEQQPGASARARARLISRRPWLHAAWLTSACASMSVALLISQILLFEFLVPVGQEGLFGWDVWMGPGLSPSAALLFLAFSAIADALVEPLYVASGFSLYLSRRSDLEAWDVELGFRRLAARVPADDAPARRPGVVAALVALIWIGLSGSPVCAQTRGGEAAGAVPAASTDPKAIIRDVLRDPVFGTEREAIEWQPKATPDASRRDRAPWMLVLQRWLERLAGLIRLLVWPSAAALVAWLVSVLIRRRPQLHGTPDTLPEALFGVDVRPESLPRDVPGQARELIEGGQLTAALGLLYRAALSALVHRSGIRFWSGDTEGDCVRRAEPVLSGSALVYFGELVSSWQQAAYGRKPPARDRAMSLCDGWAAHFSGRSPAR